MAKVNLLTETWAADDTGKWAKVGTRADLAGGSLTLDLAPDTSFHGRSSVAGWDLHDSDIYLRVNTFPVIQTADPQSPIFLRARASAGNEARFNVQGGFMTMTEEAGGVISATVIGHNQSTMRYLRLREAAGTLFWDTSPDGLTWTQRRSKTRGITLTSATIIVEARRNGTTLAPPGYARFGPVNTPQWAFGKTLRIG